MHDIIVGQEPSTFVATRFPYAEETLEPKKLPVFGCCLCAKISSSPMRRVFRMDLFRRSRLSFLCETFRNNSLRSLMMMDNKEAMGYSNDHPLIRLH